MRKITERRVVAQDWYEDDDSKTGWDSNGWYFFDSLMFMGDDWNVVEILDTDKYDRSILAIVEKETEIII
jgi:hypothetical protein